MFTTVFPPVLTVIPLRQADITYIFISYYILYISYFIYYIYSFIYISGGEDSAALGGRRRPRQDRGDAGGGKSGLLCAR